MNREQLYVALRQLYVAHQGATAPWDHGCNYCAQRMEKVMKLVDTHVAHVLANQERKQ